MVTEEEIRDLIEMPRLDTGDIFAVSRSNLALSPRRSALQVALEAEQSALRYYRRLTETTKDERLYEIYSELATFEADHTNLLEKRLAESSRAINDADLA